MPSPSAVVRLFVGTWALFFVLGALAVIMGDKLVIHAAMNQHHALWSDALFQVLTYLADGWVPTVLAFMLLIIRDVRSFLMMGLSCGLSAILVQGLKRLVFPNMDRPSKFRDLMGEMDWMPGIELHQHFSFPSGHSAAAFAMCLSLAVVLAKRRLAIPLALLAVAMAYSRIHLSQHFLQDTVAGSALGVMTAVVMHRVLYQSPFAQRPWLRYRLFGQDQNQ